MNTEQTGKASGPAEKAEPAQPSQPSGPEGRPEVEFLDLNTNREYRFHVEWSDTLQSAMAAAYVKIGEAQSDEDKLLCGDKDGASLMEFLPLTFVQLRERKICLGRKYKLRRKTGGA